VDASISIERSTPLLNDDTGSFSFPFAVPTLPNQQNLGWPGKLQRSGDIPDQTFILEDSGLQVFRGEVDYDDITANEIVLILKSGYSEFTKKMEGKKLEEIDYGNEPWPASDDYYMTIPKIFDKLAEWNTANTTDNGNYIVEKNSSDVLEWLEIGRLRELREGEGENATELAVTVPEQKKYVFNSTNLECPSLLSISKSGDSYLTPVTFLAITLYHGRKPFGTTKYPYASFDRFSISGLIDTGISFKPAYLYDTVYSELLNWQTYRARAFTKYLALSLPQLIALQWGKRYMINGVVVIFDKLNYELPFQGQLEAIGFTG